MYLLKSILHDWPDADADRIVRACRQAAPAGSRLLVIERVLPERVGPGDAYALLSDLNMMVNNGGCERTELEFRELLAEGGYRLERVIRTRVPFSALEAVPSA